MGPIDDPRRRHCDGTGIPLSITIRAVVDSAGLVGVACGFGLPQEQRMRQWMQLTDIAQDYIRPAIKATTDLLTAGGFLGRARFGAAVCSGPTADVATGVRSTSFS